MSSILTADSLGMRETGTACPHVYAVLAVVIPIVAPMLPTCASLHPDSWPAIGILMLCHKVHLLLLQPTQLSSCWSRGMLLFVLLHTAAAAALEITNAAAHAIACAAECAAAYAESSARAFACAPATAAARSAACAAAACSVGRGAVFTAAYAACRAAMMLFMLLIVLRLYRRASCTWCWSCCLYHPLVVPLLLLLGTE